MLVEIPVNTISCGPNAALNEASLTICALLLKTLTAVILEDTSVCAVAETHSRKRNSPNIFFMMFIFFYEAIIIIQNIKL